MNVQQRELGPGGLKSRKVQQSENKVESSGSSLRSAPDQRHGQPALLQRRPAAGEGQRVQAGGVHLIPFSSSLCLPFPRYGSNPCIPFDPATPCLELLLNVDLVHRARRLDDPDPNSNPSFLPLESRGLPSWPETCLDLPSARRRGGKSTRGRIHASQSNEIGVGLISKGNSSSSFDERRGRST